VRKKKKAGILKGAGFSFGKIMQKKKHVKEAIRFYSQMLFKITSCMFCCIIPCFA
jgi:hypothetical protein